jgi:hypothetical protein
MEPIRSVFHIVDRIHSYEIRYSTFCGSLFNLEPRTLNLLLGKHLGLDLKSQVPEGCLGCFSTGRCSDNEADL